MRKYLMEKGCQQRTKSWIVRDLQSCWMWVGVWAQIECISDGKCKDRVMAILIMHTCYQTGWRRMSGVGGDKAFGESIGMM